MLTLQKTIRYDGELKSTPLMDVKFEFNIPLYEYLQTENDDSKSSILNRTIIGYQPIGFTSNISDKNYFLHLPESSILGSDNATLDSFLKYLAQASKNIDDLSIRIDYRCFIETGIFTGQGTLDAIFFFKRFNSSSQRNDLPHLVKASSVDGRQDIYRGYLLNNSVLINKQAYFSLLDKIQGSSGNVLFLLDVISRLVDFKDDSPMLSKEIDDITNNEILGILKEQSFKAPTKTLEVIKGSFTDLFDFSLTIPKLEVAEIAGTFTVLTSNQTAISQSDLAYYDLSLDYSVLDINQNTSSKILRFDWSKISKIDKNTVQFSFTNNGSIVLNGISSEFHITVKGFDGSKLYDKNFKRTDPTLNRIVIEVPQIQPIKLTSSGTDITDRNKKLRGQVIVFNKKCPLKDLTVVIQAKKDGDEFYRIVGAANTDNSGNFSVPYPFGTYIEAQAIVSLTPDEPAIIPIVSNEQSDQTISDDFLYLLIKEFECLPEEKVDDCECNSNIKTTRLPDYSDLIDSDEYTQDIGGSCVNLSTPNRTLSEYNYKAIVRTSDPDVANYTLRKIENTSNPIRLLSFHGSVPVGTNTSSGNYAPPPPPSGGSGYVPPPPPSSGSGYVPPPPPSSGGGYVPPPPPSSGGGYVPPPPGGHSNTPPPPPPPGGYGYAPPVTFVKGPRYELVGGAEKIVRKPIDLNNPIAWQDAPDDHENLSFYQAVTVSTGHVLHYKALFKADGYSLGDLLYSLALAPGQKKEIVVLDSTHTLQAAESQTISQGERLAAGITDEREITNQLGGSINESLRGSSSATTSGVSAGLGVGAIIGPVGAVLGVSGGISNANSSASQDSSRDVSQFFGEKLRQSIMQNADAYRQLNASVVTTVQEGQRYTATTEVVANHNHCHALTMMYFEVLRHYAIYQELSSVEECVFVPLLMTNFTTENIYKWRDVLGTHLLPIPSNTYLQRFSFMGISSGHPLIKAFDANERIKTNYANVDFPNGSYDDEVINYLKGEINLRVNLQRPKTRYDRILSLPIVTSSSTTTNTAGALVGGTAGAVAGSIIGSVIGSVIPVVGTIIGTLIGGAIGGAAGADIGGDTTTTISLVKKQIFDSFMQLDANYQTVPPAQCIRITSFQPTPPMTFGGLTVTFSGADFFDKGDIDKKLWTAYSKILGYSSVYDMLDYYFKNRLISEWDDIFYNDLAPIIFDKIVDSIKMPPLAIDTTSTMKYRGGEKLMHISLSGNTNIKRNEFPLIIKIFSGSTDINTLKDLVEISVENVNILYSTSHYNGVLYSGYRGDDLLDGTDLYIPENENEKRNPRKEDQYLVNQLIDHLNSNLEHYNKVLWYNLDQDRRYMLLDGFDIQIYDDKQPAGFRSLASVVKNELITIVGNSLVFPVAAGYKVNGSFVTEISDSNEGPASLFDHYKPLTPIEPYRVSIPSKGIFAEAVQGACNACEKLETDRLQDWQKYPNIDEPTSILPITTPTPTITDWKAAFKDFTSPIVNIQNAPATPAPGAGLSGLSDLLGKSGIFKDITGLDANQENAIRTYLSNQENAKAFAEMAKGMAMQGHNTENSSKIMDSLKEAKNSGAISQDDYGKLVKEHLQQQIDGGESQKAAMENEKATKPTLTDAAVKAANEGKSVKAENIDVNTGKSEKVEIAANTSETVIAEVDSVVPLLKQIGNTCWATSAAMMVNWKDNSSLTVEEVVSKAGNEYLQLYLDGKNNPEDQDKGGLPSEKKAVFISALNMVAEPIYNVGPKQYIDWLKKYGPLWITTDAESGVGEFGPHARILTKITGTYSPDGRDVNFVFNNPASGQSDTESFSDFISSFEQMVTDNSSNKLFIQVVHFSDALTIPGVLKISEKCYGAFATAGPDYASALGIIAHRLIANNAEQTLNLVRGDQLFVDDQMAGSLNSKYASYIIGKNPTLNTKNKATLRKGGYLRADLLIHDGTKTEFEEIKPNSDTGVKDGLAQVKKLKSWMNTLTLPYVAGTSYVPIGDGYIPILSFKYLGLPVDIRLKVERQISGLIVYKYCIRADTSQIKQDLVKLFIIILSFIIARIGIPGRLPNPFPTPIPIPVPIPVPASSGSELTDVSPSAEFSTIFEDISPEEVQKLTLLLN